MEEVCGVGPKNLPTNFRVEELFSAQFFSRCSRCRKSLVMSTQKPDDFMQLFWTFVGEPAWQRCFFTCASDSDEWFIKFMKINFWFFPPVSFFIVLLAKSSKLKKYTNLNNFHSCFFMLCSYKKNCFCLIAMKINVKV